jgi:histidinol dehydrogenase
MRTIKTDKEFEDFFKILRKRASGVDAETVAAVAAILDDVRRRGDAALIEYTRRFDGFDNTDRIKIPDDEIKRLAATVPKDFSEALRISADRIRRFHDRQKETSWSFNDGSATLGQIITPIERVGVYVPGGKAGYPSTVLMNVIPAQIAGVKEIALCVPTPGGKINPHVMAAVDLLGVKEVYSVGGAQAIAALAYGAETIRKVDKIVGPGNIYVAAAKRMVFGEVDIDMIAGPSEILVVADEGAPAAFIAADLLSQAEHDEMASSILVTTSAKLAAAVEDEIKRQLASFERRDIAAASLLNYGAIIIVKDFKKAFGCANRIAPEHLEIMTEEPEKHLGLVKNAGAVFLGRWSPEPLGDYSAGPNHTLPTGGTARFFSPLGVYDFVKRTSLIHFTQRGFDSIADTVTTMADVEGLFGHANSVRIREVD